MKMNTFEQTNAYKIFLTKVSEVAYLCKMAPREKFKCAPLLIVK